MTAGKRLPLAVLLVAAYAMAGSVHGKIATRAGVLQVTFAVYRPVPGMDFLVDDLRVSSRSLLEREQRRARGARSPAASLIGIETAPHG